MKRGRKQAALYFYNINQYCVNKVHDPLSLGVES